MEAILHEFYSQLRQGRLLGRQCHNCGDVSFPPRGLCSRCGSLDANWFKLSGNGKLLFASSGPNLLLGGQYLMATVQLQEGPLIAGPLLEESFDFTRPDVVWNYNGAAIPVRVETSAGPHGGVVVAFRMVLDQGIAAHGN